MKDKMMKPDYVFEVSWEVCNKVGGIYTVLSTHAKSLKKELKDKLIYIGPDFKEKGDASLFTEDKSLYTSWQKECKTEGLQIRVGHWEIPSRPVAILIDFTPFFANRNDIYTQAWNDYQVDSLHGYGDYDESSMFSYAAAKVVESFYHHYQLTEKNVVYHAHEWMTGLGALYLQKNEPHIATVFTTHATSIGRSIAGNNKPLYDYLFAYNGDQMARELNMQSKHSIEKQTAHAVDCFTTVSEITAKECEELLDKKTDVVLMNGFENDFVPKKKNFQAKRAAARQKLIEVANQLHGTDWDDSTVIVGTSGRYEFKNKGIDVFIEAINRLALDTNLKKNVLAYITVPAWVAKARLDLQYRLSRKEKTNKTALEYPFLTHWLHNSNEDRASNMIQDLEVNEHSEHVKIVFVPCYLHGNDGIFNMDYYDLLMGLDMSLYPSYYEPWGYTPLESIIFKVPTITTDLAGFGRWAKEQEDYKGLETGVEVIHRSDYNFDEVANEMKNNIFSFCSLTDSAIQQIRDNASTTAEKALWKHFIKYYYKAYGIAIQKAKLRQ